MGVAVRAVRRYRGCAHSETPDMCGPFDSQRDASQTLDGCKRFDDFGQEARKLVIVDFEKT